MYVGAALAIFLPLVGTAAGAVIFALGAVLVAMGAALAQVLKLLNRQTTSREVAEEIDTLLVTRARERAASQPPAPNRSSTVL